MIVKITQTDRELEERHQMYKDKQWYDEVYAGDTAKHYRGHYMNSHFYPSYILLTLEIEPKDKILDIGCGVGQVGHLLYDRGVRDYTGFDFSENAIELAKLRPTPEHNYYIADARSTDLFDSVDYDTVISCDFFEHVIDDVEIFNKIKPGTKLHLGLPNSQGPAHVRCFPDQQTIVDRYGDMIEDIRIEGIIFKNSTWCTWIVRGIKKDKPTD